MAFTVGNQYFGRTLYPVQYFSSGGATEFGLWYHDDTNFNCEEFVSYEFKSESANLQGVTIRSIAVRYVNVDICTLSVSITGAGGTRLTTLTLGLPNPTGTGDVNQNFTYYGATPPGSIADGHTYLAFFNFEALTTEDFTVSLEIAPNSGQLMLVRLYVLGEGEEISR